MESETATIENESLSRYSKRLSTKGISRFSSLTADQTLLLEVLQNKRAAPLSFEDFQHFLDVERSGELSRFYAESLQHQKLAEEQQGSLAEKTAQNIVDHYIRTNAEQEINISDKDRSEIISKVNQGDVKDPHLFNNARREVTKMLSGEKFQRFMKKQLSENITKSEANRRRAVGVIFLILSAIIVGILMWVQTFAQAPFNVRWWRLLVLPFIFWSIGLFISAQQKVCNGLAAKCVRMREGDDWFTAFSKGNGIQQIVDDLALKNIKRKAQLIERRTYVLTFLVMVVLLAVPPGYGIGAPG